MGAVYRARDTKLGRSVAIKVLPADVAADPERIARFEREARALASLNHPRIATLFGMEHIGGRHLLVMELVEGETLAERLKNGPLSIEHTLRLALQIAEGLEAAHESGIVHRDLKPANLKVTPDDAIKILDFGLARAINPAEAGSHGPGAGGATGLTNSPTLSLMATQAGMILGTAAYMSPEQAKGHAADHRSDVFSFGVVLYEMLAGQQPFKGETAPEIMASVLVREADLTALPATIDPRLRELLRRCLEKSPKRRWQAIGDLRHELEAIAAAPQVVLGPAPGVQAAPVQSTWRRAIPLALTAAVFAAIGGGVAWWLRAPEAVSPAVARFRIPLPQDQVLTRGPSLALSPDGTQVAYVVNRQIHLRPIGELDARPVPGTESDPFRPFFSPDGRWIGFYSFQDSTIKRIAVAGGTPVTVCAVDTVPNGADWYGDAIVFAQPGKGLMRVPANANGGEPEVLVAVAPPEVPESPQMLDADTVLFTIANEPGAMRWDRAQVVIHSIRSRERTVVLSGGVGHYVPTGHLVYAVGGALLAVPFDLATRSTAGSGVPVVEGIRRSAIPAAQSGTTGVAVSASGTMAYHPGVSSLTVRRTLVLVDRSGRVDPLPLPEDHYFHPRASPMGDQLAVVTDDGRGAAIWIYDLKAGGSLRRLTFRGRSVSPIWSPDGRLVTFSVEGEGIFRLAADGTGTAEQLTEADSGVLHSPESWSPDGRTLSYRVSGLTGGGRISLWTLTAGDPAPKRLDEAVTAPHANSMFSPDGRWIAYNSNELNQSSVFVQPFPPTGAKYQVVPPISASAAWAPDGRSLFYDEGPSLQRLMVAPVQTARGVSIGTPEPIRIPGVFKPNSTWRPYDVLPDGRLLAVTTPGAERDMDLEIDVMLNWHEDLKQRVPVGR